MKKYTIDTVEVPYREDANVDMSLTVLQEDEANGSSPYAACITNEYIVVMHLDVNKPAYRFYDLSTSIVTISIISSGIMLPR